mgnify:CR=1 FL=1
MKKKPEGFMNMPLWQKGLFLMLIGPLANMVLSFVAPIVGNSEAARGQRFGQGLVTFLCVIAGVVLVILHFVRGNRDTTDRSVAKRAKSKTDAPAVRSAGKNGGSRPGNYKAIGWGLLGLSLIVSIAVLITFIAAGNQTNVPPPGLGATENSNAMKLRKSYPVSIAVPEHSVVVPPNAKLTSGTRLEACWSGKWNPITTLSENADGSLNVHWDAFTSDFDCSMIRSELIIRKDVLKQFGEFPISPPAVATPTPGATNAAASVDPKPKPLKSYPVTISVPTDSQVVPADAKLPSGTRLQACWSGKWNPITLLSENQDGNLTVRWDDFGASYDCNMLRKELIVKTDVLK